MADLLHPDCAHSQHPCFTDKMRLWRAEGVPINRQKDRPLGHGRFYDTTISEQQRQIISEAKEAGLDPIPAEGNL